MDNVDKIFAETTLKVMAMEFCKQIQAETFGNELREINRDLFNDLKSYRNETEYPIKGYEAPTLSTCSTSD